MLWLDYAAIVRNVLLCSTCAPVLAHHLCVSLAYRGSDNARRNEAVVYRILQLKGWCNITSIHLADGMVTPAVISSIVCLFPGLKSLSYCSDTDADDPFTVSACLLPLRNLPKLESISLRYSVATCWGPLQHSARAGCLSIRYNYLCLVVPSAATHTTVLNTMKLACSGCSQCIAAQHQPSCCSKGQLGALMCRQMPAGQPPAAYPSRYVPCPMVSDLSLLHFSHTVVLPAPASGLTLSSVMRSVRHCHTYLALRSCVLLS